MGKLPELTVMKTLIDQASRYVDIHCPDGKPDILQQLEHGTLNVVAQLQNIGHPVRGIIVPNLHQYHHLGDASTERTICLITRLLSLMRPTESRAEQRMTDGRLQTGQPPWIIIQLQLWQPPTVY